MTTEIDAKILGAFDSVEFDGIESLLELINLIKSLDDKAYKFVMQNVLRKIDN
jgi:hypothetical protein